MNEIERATKICLKAHDGQKRKGSDVAYAIHPFMVAMKLAQNDFSEETIAAALVHDVLEDTEYGEERMEKELGENVVTVVRTVTQEKGLSWKETKTRYIESVRNGSAESKAVALADKIHNMESLLDGIEKNGEKMWQFFSTGKEEKMWFEREMLAMLTETWSHPMIEEYESLINRIK